MDTSRSSVFTPAGVPSFDDLKSRGDSASQALHEIIEEGRQLRQTLLYSLASNRRSVVALWHARIRASRWLAIQDADDHS